MNFLKNKRSKANLLIRGLWITATMLILGGLLIAIQPSKVQAISIYLTQAEQRYPSITNTSLDSCDLCHASNFPVINAYGSAFKSHGDNAAAFGAIESLDSDGDGFTNFQEILARTFPGDASSHPVQPTATRKQISSMAMDPAATNTEAPYPPPIDTVVPNQTPTTAPYPPPIYTSTPSQVPPTATKPSPTNTPTPSQVPPTATKPSPTNTPTPSQVPPTATMPSPTHTPTPSQVPPTATKPSPTSTWTPSQVPATPTAQASPTGDPQKPGPTQSPGRVILPAIADTYVNQKNPNSNYGGKTVMLVARRPYMASFIRFDLSSMAGKPIHKIVLRLYMNGETEGSLTVSSIEDHSWSEMGMNFTNAPGSGKTLFRTRSIGNESERQHGYWIAIDVTRYINSAGLWDLMITTRSAEGLLKIATRESGGHAPQLVFIMSQ
ncbi:MAG TPA: DNRLRE domain-containing protein [Anaerolineaceae bacterium]|nr:DNRLRE domain-containing protein [Anaerolineaceae bacterium]